MSAVDTPTPSAGQETPDQRKNVEAILPLLPNQKGLLLYRDLTAGEDPGFLQVRFALHGPLDTGRLQDAWASAMRWHPALRMSIHTRESGDPMAVVWRTAELPWSVQDWSDRTVEDQERQMALLLESDRERGLDLSQAPAMRVTIVRIAADHHEVIWTCHHLLSDGWSAAVALEDVLDNYRASAGAPVGLAPPPPDGLRAYVAWATQQDTAPAEVFWRERLHGFTGLPPLHLGDTSPGASGPSEETVALDPHVVGLITKMSAALHVTPNAFIQAAWSMVLRRLYSEADVVFGTTVAGRSAPIEGMERLVGYFSNAVPIRSRIDDSEAVSSWLRRLRDEQFELHSHEHASLADIHDWSDVPSHRSLFETLLVFENLPRQSDGNGSSDEVSMTNFRSGLTAAFPLTIAVTLGDPWILHGRFDRGRCHPQAVRRVVTALAETLEAIGTDADQTVGSLTDSMAGDLPTLLSRPASPTSQGTVYRAPTTQVERQLADIWSEVLELPRVGIDDDYFDLGGTSLNAVRLFDRIAGEFGRSLPLNTLLRYPTIDGLAAALEPSDRSEPETRPSLVPIQTTGDRIPIVCIHGGGGEVLIYRDLAKHLGPDQPVYGLEPVGLDGQTAPLDSIPAMAARYIRELRAVQPHGPYRVVGYCFGGSVGLEMARQLEDVGEEVDSLVVIDGGLPLETARAASTFARGWAVLRARGPREAIRAGIRRYAHRGKVLWDGSFGGTEGAERARYRSVAEAADRAFGTFHPRPSQAPITLIRSTRDHFGLGSDWHIGWDAYTPKFESVAIDSDHYSLFSDAVVDQVADAIRSRLPDTT